jgi:hypothetical protein
MGGLGSLPVIHLCSVLGTTWYSDDVILSPADIIAYAVGAIGVFAGRKNVPRLCVDDRKPVRSGTPIIKNYKAVHVIC